jgi:hypothetical protein
MRGHQIALDTIDQELNDVFVSLLVLLRQAPCEPLAQTLAFDRSRVHRYASLFQRCKPFRCLRLSIQGGQRDQDQRISIERGGQLLQAVTAILSGLPVGDAQIEDLSGRKKGKTAAGHGQFAPVEAGVCDQDAPFCEAMLQGFCTNAIGRFQHQQQFLPENDVKIFQSAGQMLGKLFGVNAHCCCRLAVNLGLAAVLPKS